MANPTTPGTLIGGKYKVDRVLGHGAMGVVVEARHLGLGERVAIKLLNAQYAQQAEASARFLREARAASKIKGERVARVLDVGPLEDGTPYIVMELLQGADLSHVLSRTGPLAIVDAVDYVIQACEPIAEAHGYGIIHRDIKPANLFLTTRPGGAPLVKVLDFGISKQIGSIDDLGRSGAAMGSALYMSPEQMQKTRTVDRRTDIYALGITLFELIAGRPPYHAKTLPDLCAQVLHGTPTSLRRLRPGAPEALCRVIEKAYARDREHRHITIAELVSSLAPFAPPRSRAVIDAIAGSGARPAFAPRSADPPPRMTPPMRIGAGTDSLRAPGTANTRPAHDGAAGGPQPVRARESTPGSRAPTEHFGRDTGPRDSSSRDLLNRETDPPQRTSSSELPSGSAEIPALIVLWSRDEPARIGEALIPPLGHAGPWVFGRGDAVTPEERHRRLLLVRPRPGALEPSAPLECARISRDQIRISRGPLGSLVVENTGRCALAYGGRDVPRTAVRAGEIIELRNELMLLCVHGAEIPGLPAGSPPSLHSFGQADSFGLVGESAAIWAVRRKIAEAARLEVGASITGPRGSGKALVAAAVQVNARSAGRNDVRIEIPGLEVRRQDIPLLATHLLRRRATTREAALERFFPGGATRAVPRIAPALIQALVQHRYATHVRELDDLLTAGAIGSHGKYVELTSEVRRRLDGGASTTRGHEARG